MSPHVPNQIEGTQANQVITTHDPALVANNLPMYPPLPINYDAVQIEEIRRTLLISNLDPSVTAQQITDFFFKAGDVKYVRLYNKELENGMNYALIEFSEQTSIINGLKLNGIEMGGKPITVSHSTVNIDKPQTGNEATQKDIETSKTPVNEARNLTSAAIDPIGISSIDKREQSRSRKRSRSRSRGRRTRSRSKKRTTSSSRKKTRSSDGKKYRSRSKSRARSRDSSRSRSKSKRTENKSNVAEMGGRLISVFHSTVNIDKPQAKSNVAAQRAIEEAMARMKEAQQFSSAAIDRMIGISSIDKRGRSISRGRRSRSRGRRSRSRSRGRRSRSRSRGRRSRSRSRGRRSRSRTRSRDLLKV